MRVILEGSPYEIAELIGQLERRSYTITTTPTWEYKPWWTEVTCTSPSVEMTSDGITVSTGGSKTSADSLATCSSSTADIKITQKLF